MPRAQALDFRARALCLIRFLLVKQPSISALRQPLEPTLQVLRLSVVVGDPGDSFFVHAPGLDLSDLVQAG